MTLDQLLDSLMRAESGGNSRAVSRKGAQGAFQFMPRTARSLGIDPFDPVQAREGARRYLTYLLGKFPDRATALAAWNWGEGNVARSMRASGGRFDLSRAPAETQAFVPRVLGGRYPSQRPAGGASLRESGRAARPLSQTLLGLARSPADTFDWFYS